MKRLTNGQGEHFYDNLYEVAEQYGKPITTADEAYKVFTKYLRNLLKSNEEVIWTPEKLKKEFAKYKLDERSKEFLVNLSIGMCQLGSAYELEKLVGELYVKRVYGDECARFWSDHIGKIHYRPYRIIEKFKPTTTCSLYLTALMLVAHERCHAVQDGELCERELERLMPWLKGETDDMSDNGYLPDFEVEAMIEAKKVGEDFLSYVKARGSFT